MTTATMDQLFPFISIRYDTQNTLLTGVSLFSDERLDLAEYHPRGDPLLGFPNSYTLAPLT